MYTKNSIEEMAKNILEKNGSHQPQFIIINNQTKEADVILTMFGNDEEKMRVSKMMRKAVEDKKADEYFFIMEAFVGKNIDIRPKDDPKRVEVLIVNHMKKDLTGKIIIFEFEKTGNKIKWGKRTESNQNDTKSVWDFYREEISPKELYTYAKKESEKFD